MTTDLAKYWLLDSAALGRPPLEWLAAENLCEIFNTRYGHGLSFTALLDTLDRLFLAGDLIAERMEGNELFGTFAPTHDDISAGLTGQLCLYYGLTSQGGARWEAFARPDWHRYIDAGYWSDSAHGEMGFGEIAAWDKYSAEQYLAMHYDHYVEPLITVHATSEQWSTLAPWPVTYWKTLPQAHRVRFTYHEEYDQAVVDGRWLWAQHCPSDAKAWLDSMRNWYTRDW